MWRITFFQLAVAERRYSAWFLDRLRRTKEREQQLAQAPGLRAQSMLRREEADALVGVLAATFVQAS